MITLWLLCGAMTLCLSPMGCTRSGARLTPGDKVGDIILARAKPGDTRIAHLLRGNTLFGQCSVSVRMFSMAGLPIEPGPTTRSTLWQSP